MLIDGSGIAASAGTVVFSSSSHGTLRMNTDPENNSALTSMWQRNLQGLLCERWFGFANDYGHRCGCGRWRRLLEQRDGLIMSEHNIEQEGAHSALPPPSPGKSRLTKGEISALMKGVAEGLAPTSNALRNWRRASQPWSSGPNQNTWASGLRKSRTRRRDSSQIRVRSGSTTSARQSGRGHPTRGCLR